MDTKPVGCVLARTQPETCVQARTLHLCLVVVLAGAASPGWAEPPLAVPVDGGPFRAELDAVDADWRLTFRSDKKRRLLPAADLVRWGNCAEATRGQILVLADGGLLAAEVFDADKETLTADSDLFSAVKLPLEMLAGVVFHPPAAALPRDLLLDRAYRATGQSDLIVLQNGDALAGQVEAIEDDVVKLRAEIGPLEIETDRIAALVFNPDLKQAPGQQGLRAWAGFEDGSLLRATRLVLDGSSLRITTAGGRTWQTRPQSLVYLQPLGGQVTYLGGLKPAGYRHVPFLDLAWPYHPGRNAVGGRLRSGGRLYPMGIGMHSAARLTYQLDRPYRRFQAKLGIDDSAGGGGSVRFRVYVDGRQKYTGGTVRGGDSPLPVSVDLEGARRIDLIVDFADRADQQDHADWLDARLVHTRE